MFMVASCLPKHPPGACLMVIFLFVDDLVLTKLKRGSKKDNNILKLVAQAIN